MKLMRADGYCGATKQYLQQEAEFSPRHCVPLHATAMEMKRNALYLVPRDTKVSTDTIVQLFLS